MYSSSLPAYPTSWYAIAYSDQVAPGALVSRKLAGREVVLFRTASGALGVLDAHCPHMGAHFAHGGKVVGEVLQCPFHGFCFDTDGRCVRTGYDTQPPPKAKAPAMPVVERHGVVLAWHDDEGRQPSFDIPAVDTTGWSPLRHHAIELRSNVQEIAENSVDIGHFAWVHKYEGFRAHGELKIDGPYLNARYGLRRPRKMLGTGDFEMQFEIHQYGLGYARIEVELPELAIRARQFVMARPLDEDTVELNIAMMMQILEPAKINPVLGVFPRRLVTRLVTRMAFREFRTDVLQDQDVWNNKVFLPRPALAAGDGPIGKYRRWARQFHPVTALATVPAELP